MSDDLFESAPEEDKYFEMGGETEAPDVDRETSPEPESPKEPEAVETKEEVKAETKEEAPEDKTDSQLENLNKAVSAERYRANEAEKQLKEQGAQIQQLMGLKEQLEARRQEARQQTDAERFEEDPIGTLKSEVDTIKQQSQQTQQYTQEQQAQAQKMQQLQGQMVQKVQAFETEHKDYGQAFDYFRGVEIQKAQLMGMNEFEAAHQVDSMMTLQGMQLVEQGLDPAQMLYEAAKIIGYQQSQETPAQDDKAVEQQLDKLEKGQGASKTLAGTSQGSENDLSLSDVETMDDEEFDQLWSELEKTEAKH